MSKEQLVNRMICAEASIDSHKLRTGNLADEDWPRLAEAVSRLSKANIYIDDTPGITVAEMRSKCRRLKLERGLELVLIDYLQLMQGSGRAESRQQEISEISRSLKALAREMDCPVLAISQLSRAPEMRSEHRPMLSDLRESGAIEQDADVVMFLYRDEYYHPDTEKKGIAEVILAKQRNGPTGTVELVWLDRFTKFADMAKFSEE
jgi:replicative DNA helicase